MLVSMHEDYKIKGRINRNMVDILGNIIDKLKENVI